MTDEKKIPNPEPPVLPDEQTDQAAGGAPFFGSVDGGCPGCYAHVQPIKVGLEEVCPICGYRYSFKLP